MRRLLIAATVLVLAVAGIVLVVQLTASDGSSAATSGPGTLRTVLRPVHRDGTPAAGWQVSSQQVDGFACDEGASPVAVDPDIRSCGYTALGTISCWRSTGHTVLCLTDAFTRRLVRVRYTGSFADVVAPTAPVPQALTLTTGARCRVRDGGAWDRVDAHPTWVGGYWCGSSALYGPSAGYGLDTLGAQWTANEVAGVHQTVTPRTVAHAWFVGTAA